MTNASFDDSDFVPPEAPDVPEVEDRPYRSRRKDDVKRYGEFRQPPSDREAEQGVLGAMLLSPNTGYGSH